MNVQRSRRIARLLSLAGLMWCAGVGVLIWFMPIRGSGVSTVTWSTYTASGIVTSGRGNLPVESARRFAEISYFGALPLALPVLFAAVAVWAAWRRRPMVLAAATILLCTFCFLAGFSIGPAYLLGAAATAGALVLTLIAHWTTGEDAR